PVAVRDLRARRRGLADSRGAAAAALHELPPRARLRPRRDPDGADGGARGAAAARDLERLFPLLLRLDRSGSPGARRADLVLVHDGECPLGLAPGWIAAQPVADAP